MDMFSLLALFGGVAFFLFGMKTMSLSLGKISGERLESLLGGLTSNPFRGAVLGALITVGMQSSSAVTVMLVGLVDSGVMAFDGAVSVVIGSNIGTTFTSWILSLSGTDSGSILLNLLSPEGLAPLAAVCGIILMTASKSVKRRELGRALMGFSILFYGMHIMRNAAAPLAESDGFQGLLVAFGNPMPSLIVGALFTGIIQSSAASVGILQALSASGFIPFRTAFPIVLGQNIGTCVTALIASIGVGANARRVAAVHLIFNLSGALICFLIFITVDLLFAPPFFGAAVDPFTIALSHTVFNLIGAAVFLPASRAVRRRIKGNKIFT